MNIENFLAQITGQRHESQLEAQLRELRREIRRVSQSVARHAGHTTDDLGENLHDFSREAARRSAEFSREAARRGAEFAEIAAHQAGRSAKALRQDPLPAIAILGTAFLVARLFSRR